MNRVGVALAGALVISAALQGCVSVRSSHGYVLERGEDAVDAKIGLDTKDSVLARYGEPSMKGTFNPNAWYYMASLDSARAFFKPKTHTREIISFHFNDDGVVEEIGRRTLEDGMDIRLVSRKTPTRGKQLSFWEQLLGNVGQLPAPGGPQGPQ